MIVWGGSDPWDPKTGGRYNPAANGGAGSWATMDTTDAPSSGGPAVWTGSEMIIWGGFGTDFHHNQFLADGGRYDPSANDGDGGWSPLPVAGAPSERFSPTAVWTGTQMLVWGGTNAAWYPSADGGRFGLGNIGHGSVGTTEIAAGGVLSANIASGAVQSGNIAAGGVHSLNIATGAVGNMQIGDGAVFGAKLAPNLTLSGTVSADGFAGDGSALTNLNAANLTGTITTLGGLIIENRTDDPPTPATGRIWLRTDL